MTRTTARKRSLFWPVYLGFLLVLALLWAAVIWYVAGCMRTYEAAQPERIAERLAGQLQAGEPIPGMDFQALCSRFEDGEACAAAWSARLEGKTLSCEKAADSYDAKAPVYNLLADGEPAAAVALRETSSYPLMFILSVPEWEVTSVTPEMGTAGAPLRITVPDSFTVKINGVEADERERAGESRPVEEFQYAAAYTDVPELVDYEIGGLFLPPEIEILDYLGRRVDCAPDGENRIDLEEWPPAEEMDGELRDYVLQNAKNYSNFFSADLRGSSASTAPIRYMFPEDSDYLTLAENYRRHDMWMYSPHHAPTFSGEEVSGYIPYSEDFFSCQVGFDKKMILSKTGQERHDIHKTRYYYVKIDGKWLIADMRAVLDETT